LFLTRLSQTTESDLGNNETTPNTYQVPTRRGKRLAIRRRPGSNRVLELNESCWSCISFTYLVCRVRNLVGPREPILRDHHTLADHIAVVILFAVALNSMCPEPVSVKVPCDLSHILTSLLTTPIDQCPHPWKSLRPSLLLTLGSCWVSVLCWRWRFGRG